MKRMWKAIRLFFSGIVVGVANIIPGVSGGTMAVVLGVFDQLIETLSLKKIKKNIFFIIFVALGGGAGVLAFSKLIKYLLATYPLATNFTFIGLILGSIPMIFGRARGGKRPIFSIAVFFVAFALMASTALISKEDTATAATSLTLPLTVILFATGIISTFAMILPGISGSMMMVIFRQYATVTGAIAVVVDMLLGRISFSAALPTVALLIPFGIGAVIGLVFGARLIGAMMEKNAAVTYSAILGMILGSIPVIYMEIPGGFTFGWEGVIAVILLAAGTAGAFLFSKTEK